MGEGSEMIGFKHAHQQSEKSRKQLLLCSLSALVGGRELVMEESRFYLHISWRIGEQSGRTAKPFVGFQDEENCENLKFSLILFDH